jgi:hypothetical protein
LSIAPFQAVKKAMVSNHLQRPLASSVIVSKASGNAPPSFTASLLEELSHMSGKPADEEDVIRGAGSTAYTGGSDTVISLLL